MIEESGMVVEIDDRYAWVEAERRSSCGSCSAKGCGTGALANVLGGRRQRLRVENSIGAEVGDNITIGLREDALVRGSLAVYIVPLLAMLAGALLGESLAPRAEIADLWAVCAGLAGFGVGLWWLRRFSRRVASGGRYQAVALRIAARSGVSHISIDELAKR